MLIDLFVCGYCRLGCPQEEATALFEALRQLNLTPKAPKRDEKTGKFSFLCSLRGAAKLRRVAPALSLTEEACGGLPVLLRGLLRRPGLLLGVLLGVALLVAARLFVWEVEITGNSEIPTEEVLEELSALGLSCGSFIPNVDGEEIALRLRRGDGRIAYASVNLTGTVASVQIREAVLRKAPATAPADIMATRDGVVTMPLAFAGECLVREGDVVRAGQVLVSGVLNSEKQGPRLCRAAGQILARTTHTYTVTVPFSYQEKCYNGQDGTELRLHFFGFEGNFFKTTGNTEGMCDIILNNYTWTMSDGRQVPLGITAAHHLGYEWESATRTAEKALTLARAELEARLAADSAGRTVLERVTEMQADADGITLRCTVVCEEDIARVAELALLPNS